jgi:phosphatidylserine/phosphatidylglycerophosphate/cardiolipin synthase-like enzyme
MVEALKGAERYIFLEYFIVEAGIMWDTILEILKEKAKAGVDVRMIYDDVGSIMTLPFRYDRNAVEEGKVRGKTIDHDDQGSNLSSDCCPDQHNSVKH